MKKLTFAIISMVLLSACSSTITTTTTGADGKPQKVEMSEDAFIETERLKTNEKIVDKQVALIEKGQEARQSKMDSPLLKLSFTSMNCSSMKDGNCLVEVAQPITTEMLKADSQATTAQLAQIKTIEAPTNFNDVLKSGITTTGSIVNTVANGVINKAEIFGLVSLGKAGISATKELGVAIAGKTTSIDNSVTTTDRHDIIENNTDVGNDKSQILTDVDNDKSVIEQSDFNNDKSIKDSHDNNSVNHSNNSKDDNSSVENTTPVEPEVIP
jgi:hypothetical protein